MAGSSGGMNAASDCPNMWLSGSRFSRRSGSTGRAQPRYLAISRFDRNDVGQDVAVRDHHALRLAGRARGEDDLGDVVAVDGHRRRRAVAPVEIAEPPHRPGDTGRRAGHVVADEDEPGLHQPGDALEERRRGARVDRHHHHPGAQAAPEGDHPFGTVLAPDDGVVALGQPGRQQAGRKAPRRRRDLGVAVAARTEAVVVDEVGRPDPGEVRRSSRATCRRATSLPHRAASPPPSAPDRRLSASWHKSPRDDASSAGSADRPIAARPRGLRRRPIGRIAPSEEAPCRRR